MALERNYSLAEKLPLRYPNRVTSELRELGPSSP